MPSMSLQSSARVTSVSPTGATYPRRAYPSDSVSGSAFAVELPVGRERQGIEHLIGGGYHVLRQATSEVAIANDLVRLQLGHGDLDRGGGLLGRTPTQHSRRRRTSSSYQINKADSWSSWAGRRAVQPPLDSSTRSKRPSRSVCSMMRSRPQARPVWPACAETRAQTLHEGVATSVSTRLQRATSYSSSEYTRTSSVPPPMIW